MPSYVQDTIAAVATAPGKGGIGVVRVSSRDLAGMIQGLLGRELPPRRAVHARFLDAQGAALDDGIALYFQGPQSFTGEHVLELQGHGGPMVLQNVLERCLELGARIAEPGEFSRRAFLNGRLDLVQAEAIADLIDAGSQVAARSAVRALEGEFSRRINQLKEAIIHLRMLVEATLDFPEEDIDFLEKADAWRQLDSVSSRLDEVLAQARQGALLRDGLNVVLIGQPNVGKSSLMNQLAGYEVAIVTEIAGTTRDTVREAIQIQGVPLHIVDTAGLRETSDTIERMGIERTWSAVEQADIALLLIDASHGVGPEEAAILRRLPGIPVITIHNKIDLTGEIPHQAGNSSEIWLSAKHGAGMELLRGRLLELAGWQAPGEGVCTARVRHLDALRRCQMHLSGARAAGRQLEFFAEELRLAHRALAEITGEFSADDLLGVIFSRFCIGK